MSDRAFETNTVVDDADFAPGARVRIRSKPIGVTLASTTGTIVGADEWDGYYIVRLDLPARYHCADGHTEPLQEIREAGDNLTILPSPAA